MRSQKPKKAAIEQQATSSDGADCSCQLLDTSLENVGDSDCSCSQCLEANLEAFNEIKQQEEEQEKLYDHKSSRGLSTRINSNKQTRGVSKGTVRNDSKTVNKLSLAKSDKIRVTRLAQQERKQSREVSQNNQVNNQGQFPRFSRQSFNDYLKITQHRARQYLNRRKGLEISKMKERSQLKTMIKENLQALKFTAQAIRKQYQKSEQNAEEKSGIHGYKWSHEPYTCKSRVQCRKRRPYQPDLQEKKEEIQKINQRIKQFKEKTMQNPYECPDQCPRHHMRTSKQKLAKIQKFIQKKAREYIEARNRQKLERQQQKMIKQAKMRAIDIKSRQRVARAKKYDPTIQRTSFHNSIDHYSTFSQLKMNNKEVLQQKQRRKQRRVNVKDGKKMQQAIYEDLDDQLIADHPPIYSNIHTESRYVHNNESEEWCEKIVKQAKIKPPKDVKHSDKLMKGSNQKKQLQEAKKGQDYNKKGKNVSTKDLKKEELRRKQIQLEIERKKQQIFKEFQKRSNNQPTKIQPKNKALRQQYEQKLKGQTYGKNHPPQNLEIDHQRDIYSKSGRVLMQKKMLKI